MGRKIIILIGILVILLVACGKKETPTGGIIAPTSSETQPAQTQEQKKTVVTEETVKTFEKDTFCENVTLLKLKTMHLDAVVFQAICDITKVDKSLIQQDSKGNLLVQIRVAVSDAEKANSDLASEGINVMSTIQTQDTAEITVWTSPSQIKDLSKKDYVVLIHLLPTAT